ncbi:MAG: polyribonucleotide nucleotidyltransferase [Acidimicrobiia bacterium]|nr:MAG: polyribonucleotide nucleotidyltransferase [Acidimicrobiia bacterium]
MPEITVSAEIGGKTFQFSTGKLALQADGAVVARLGGIEMLVTACANKALREGIDFFPLTVDFEERMYAAGKIPGSFFRREGRPTEQAILAARLIDRPLRPSFADGFRCETQVVVTSLAVDNENPFDVVALNGASAALMVSPIPFLGPIGGVRMALRKGEWIPFPTHAELDESVFELVVAGRRNSDGGIDVMMVEAGATEEGVRLVKAGDPPSDEAAVAEGLEAAKPYIDQLIQLQLDLAARVTPREVEWPVAIDYTEEILHKVEEVAPAHLEEVIRIADKRERSAAEEKALAATLEAIGLSGDDADPVQVAMAARAFKYVSKKLMRRRVVTEGVRLDGRGPTDIRPIVAEVGVVGRTHGSGLFQRGETQVLTIATLGMLKMEQLLDNLGIDESKRYMHHYNFPPFSTGEAGFMRGPRRREIGHGALAEKAVLPVVPTEDEFPYALRLVSEVLSSNGSTSMASVCASSLALMDAGVPIIEPVGGIAMGLIYEEGRYVTLTDILGAEDALGDMDFKVAGTADMITALQLDTKIQGLPSEVLREALEQARTARLHILEKMREAIPAPRPELSRWAPRIEAVEIPKDKIGEVIGPKGKVVRELEEETGATIEIDEDGNVGIVRIASNDAEVLKAAKERVLAIAYPPEPEIGKVYEGEVVNITKFGAFINILPGRDGLLHISKLDASRRVERVEDHLKLGDRVKVRLAEIDRNGKLSLDLAEPLGDGSEGEAPTLEPAEQATGPKQERPTGSKQERRSEGDKRRAAPSFEETFERMRKG